MSRENFGSPFFVGLPAPQAGAVGTGGPGDRARLCAAEGIMGKLVQQFMKFGVVGAAAFVIDYGLMVALTELAGVEYLLSATISFTASVVFNYLASMRYVFTHKEGLSRRREFVIFVVLSVIGLAINDALMFLGTSFLGISYLITKIAATAVVMVYNFVTRKKFLDAGDTAAIEPLELL